MERVKTKHQNSGRKKEIKRITSEAVDYMLTIFYISLKDELDLSVEEVRRVKERIDRYSSYLSDGVLSFNDIKKDLKKAGYNI